MTTSCSFSLRHHRPTGFVEPYSGRLHRRWVPPCGRPTVPVLAAGAMGTDFFDPSSISLSLVEQQQQQSTAILGADPQSFEPQLNVPALFVFVLIAVVFGLLQCRMAAVGIATNERTDALDRLRRIKSQQLENKVSVERVEQATRAYREAFERVERLRQIIPGIVRIPIPPGSETRERRLANLAAAQQFLNLNATQILLTWPEEDEDKDINMNTLNDPNKRSTSSPQQQQHQQQTKAIPEWVMLALLMLAVSQVFLVWLFTLDFDTVQQILITEFPMLE